MTLSRQPDEGAPCLPMLPIMNLRPLLLLPMILVVVLGGCGPSQSGLVATLSIEQTGWDTLRVGLDVQRHALMRNPEVVAEAQNIYTLFGVDYDTLYTGPGPEIPVPDADLGDAEQLLLEGCRQVEQQQVCEQEVVLASPKRLQAEADIQYPEDAAYEKGRYSLVVHVERRAFDGADWYPIRPKKKRAQYLRVFVDEVEQDAVTIPLTRKEGQFTLKGASRYEAFRYNLRSHLLDQHQAAVNFEIYAHIGKNPVRLVSYEKVIRPKTAEERVEELGTFVEQAAAKILDRMEVERSGAGTHVFVNSWTYQPALKQYVSEVQLYWKEGGGFFRDRWYDLTGRLEVKEDGLEATFQFVKGNNRARHLWQNMDAGETLRLAPLTPPRTVVDVAGLTP